MSTLGYNVATYKADLLFLLEGAHSSNSSYSYTDAHIYRALNMAQDDVQFEYKVLQGVDITTDVVGGTSAYYLPSNIFGTGVVSVGLMNTSGNYVPLPRIGTEEALRLYDPYGATAGSGDAEAWALAPGNPRQIMLFPTPATSQTGGLFIRYNAIPTPLYRMWRPSDYTIEGTHGDITLTFSSIPPDNQVIATDEIGVIPTTQADGTTVSDALPVRWYKVQSLLNDVATLGEAFEGCSAAAFVTAQVSDLEQRFPGKMREALVLLAAARLRESESPQQAAQFRDRAAVLLSAGLLDEDSTILPGRRQADIFPQFFNNNWT